MYKLYVYKSGQADGHVHSGCVLDMFLLAFAVKQDRLTWSDIQ